MRAELPTAVGRRERAVTARGASPLPEEPQKALTQLGEGRFFANTLSTGEAPSLDGDF